MKKQTNQIIAQIRTLLDELEAGVAGTDNKVSTKKILQPKSRSKNTVGCSGAIQGLIEEGFFDQLRDGSQVVDKLKQEGQPYSKELVSMNLLNLVKPPRRILRRIKENNKWQYIVRR